MFGVFAIDEILRYRGTRFPGSRTLCHPGQEDNCHPHFFSLFWRTFLGFFDLQLMEDIKDGKEEVLDEVVMEHIK